MRLPEEINNRLYTSARAEYFENPLTFQFLCVIRWDDASHDNCYITGVFTAKRIENRGHGYHMVSGKTADSNVIDRFLYGSGHNAGWRQVPGEDDFKARIAQSSCNDDRSTPVSIHADLCDQYALVTRSHVNLL